MSLILSSNVIWHAWRDNSKMYHETTPFIIFMCNEKKLHEICEFCKISKNTFFHRTPLVAASEPGF